MPTTQETKQKPSSELLAQAKGSPTLQYMIARGLPLTKDTFVGLAYAGDEMELEDLTAEQLQDVPAGLT